jgi:hypothetical protein
MPALLFAKQLPSWAHVLDGYAMQVNPLLGQGEILAIMRYDWKP